VPSSTPSTVKTCSPEEAVSYVRTVDTIDFGLGPANPAVSYRSGFLNCVMLVVMADTTDESQEANGAGDHNDWLIDEAGEETFPASDPSSTWSGPDRADPAVEEAGE